MLEPVGKFSKKTKEEKIAWLCATYLPHLPDAESLLKDYWLSDKELQRLHDDFIENSISNYILPFGIAPNFLINDSLYTIPMVIEESSVVAAASNAAKFWLKRGGFQAEVIATLKNGQVHLNYFGKKEVLYDFFKAIKSELLESIASIEKNMKQRGGGLRSLDLNDRSESLKGYYQLHATFETGEAMGANFINSCLEKIAETFQDKAQTHAAFDPAKRPEVVMSILSNYVPECRVRASVSCPVEELDQAGLSGKQFAEKFVRAIDIAKCEVRRAVTHNKGIMNGIDAVIVATGNDFRAVEAGIHAYASKEGTYTSLTDASLENGIFSFSIEIPLAIGTVGGLTSLHPMVRLAFEILQKPSAEELMQIVAVAGLAQNFAAVRSLVTTGIQKGHMKMHLMNILNQLKATPDEVIKAQDHFERTGVSHSAVVTYIEQIRS